MFEGGTPAYILTAILLTGAITWILRALPFALLAPLRDSELLDYLGTRMPVGIMVILTVYTLIDLDTTTTSMAGTALIALAVTIGLHLWRSNMLLSLFSGTAVYVVLASILTG